MASKRRCGRVKSMDQKGIGLMKPTLKARNLVKLYGTVTALNHRDFDLHSREILAVTGVKAPDTDVAA